MRGCACKTARVLPRDCSGAWSAATVCGGRGALWGFVADECEHVCETYPELEGSLMCHGAFTGKDFISTPRTPDRRTHRCKFNTARGPVHRSKTTPASHVLDTPADRWALKC